MAELHAKPKLALICDEPEGPKKAEIWYGCIEAVLPAATQQSDEARFIVLLHKFIIYCFYGK